jgi:hypothetical protein
MAMCRFPQLVKGIRMGDTIPPAEEDYAKMHQNALRDAIV